MKSFPKWLLPVSFIVIVLAIVASAMIFSEKTPIILSGKIVLDDSLTDKASGIRSLFIVLYNADSNMPMPFGAQRERVSEDAQGEFLDFFITRERLQRMNEDLPFPRNFRIKVRLDRDGAAGPDQPGDLTGEIGPVAIGSTDITVKIDRLVDPNG